MITSAYDFLHIARANMLTEDELELLAKKHWPFMSIEQKLSLLEVEGVTKNWIREKEGFPPISNWP